MLRRAWADLRRRFWQGTVISGALLAAAVLYDLTARGPALVWAWQFVAIAGLFLAILALWDAWNDLQVLERRGRNGLSRQVARDHITAAMWGVAILACFAGAGSAVLLFDPSMERVRAVQALLLSGLLLLVTRKAWARHARRRMLARLEEVPIVLDSGPLLDALEEIRTTAPDPRIREIAARGLGLAS
jgi:hypothetical protein